jgi:hypothetical protein
VGDWPVFASRGRRFIAGDQSGYCGGECRGEGGDWLIHAISNLLILLSTMAGFDPAIRRFESSIALEMAVTCQVQAKRHSSFIERMADSGHGKAGDDQVLKSGD